MQMWHPGDYRTIDPSLFPCCLVQLPEKFNYRMLEKNRYTLKDEEAGMGNRQQEDRVLVWAEYIVIGLNTFIC